MSLTEDDKERGYWRYILFDGRYKHTAHRSCANCDFLLLAGLASSHYHIPVQYVGWKHIGFYWVCLHPEVTVTPPTESQILYHARQPEFSFLEYVELRVKSLRSN